MHRITCNEADRLARDLRRAEQWCRDAAHQHADMFAAMRILGNGPLAEYHHGAHTDAGTIANELRNYANALQERKPLWEKGTGPNDHPRALTRLTSRTRKAIEARTGS